MTCPKNPVPGVTEAPAHEESLADNNWDMDTSSTKVASPNVFSDEERKNIQELMSRLGL